MTKNPHRMARGIGANRQGHRAEDLAKALLHLKGYHLLATRYKTREGEIDLIVRRGDVIAMVEVKARATLAEAVEAVSPRQQRRIIAAAAQYRAEQEIGEDITVRFDIIAIAPPWDVVHLPNAWMEEVAF